jgi:small subunit ribosomal protein S10
MPLPTYKKHFSVPRSPFTDKDSREAFMITVHKRLVDIIEPTDKTIDSLMHLELPAGVDIEIKM